MAEKFYVYYEVDAAAPYPVKLVDREDEAEALPDEMYTIQGWTKGNSVGNYNHAIFDEWYDEDGETTTGEWFVTPGVTPTRSTTNTSNLSITERQAIKLGEINTLINDDLWTQGIDSKLSVAQRTAFATYLETLRNIPTAQSATWASNPEGVTMPTRPTEAFITTDAYGQIALPININLLPNSDFRNGFVGFAKFGVGLVNTQSVTEVRAANNTYAGKNYPTLWIYQNGTAINGTTDYADIRSRGWNAGVDDIYCVSVTPGEYYEASANIATVRCAGELMIQYLDSSGVAVGTSSVAVSGNIGNTTNPDTWQRYGVRRRASKNGVDGYVGNDAAFAITIFRKYGTVAGSDSFLALHKPQIIQTNEFATVPQPFRGVVNQYFKGLTAFGGKVQSDTYTASTWTGTWPNVTDVVPGAGWALQDGNDTTRPVLEVNGGALINGDVIIPNTVGVTQQLIPDRGTLAPDFTFEYGIDELVVTTTGGTGTPTTTTNNRAGGLALQVPATWSGSVRGKKENYFSVSEGDKFIFKFKSIADATYTGFGSSVIKFYQSDKTTEATGPIGVVFLPGTTWGESTYEVTAPANAKWAAPHLGFTAGGTGNVRIDGFVVERKPDGAKLAEIIGAAVSHGGLGTYAFLRHNTANTAIVLGNNYAGSDLVWAGVRATSGGTASLLGSATTVSGTWKAMCNVPAAVSEFGAGVFLRIA